MVAKVVIPTIPTSMPLNSIVRTGSYTVPTGQHSFVTANCHAGGTFTINGGVALRSLSVGDAATNANVTLSASNPSYTVPAKHLFYPARISASNSSGTCQINIGSQPYTSSSNASITWDAYSDNTTAGASISNRTQHIFAAGTIINITNASGTSLIRGRSMRVSDLFQTSVSGSFWVPSGTVLNKTGTGEYVTMNYDN